MKTVYPAFDMETMTWFITDPCELEAPTLRELRRLLYRRWRNHSFAIKDWKPMKPAKK